MLRYRYVIGGWLYLMLCACNTKESKIPNTPTTGSIHIMADNTFHYIVPPQMDLFTSIYKNTTVKWKFNPEQVCIQSLLEDSCKLILVSRKLSEKETRVFEQNNLIIHQTPLAKSAIVLLGKPFKEKGITVEQFKQILSGQGPYKIVFFGKMNGAVLYCKDSLLNGKSFGKNCFETEDTSAFRNYVMNNSNMIGVIDYARICDDDDKWTKLLKYPEQDTMVIPVRKKTDIPAYYPDQSNIATSDYPLTRVIYCIRRGENFSLSAGLEAFLAGDKGQVLFKKMGLVPIIDRERKIEIKPY
ncbi:MAG: substrate-binding domain-containing protein [Bacteroidia bacterium]|nr:substrate-binding domain-containing protein [Bacteroidia bacterium]